MDDNQKIVKLFDDYNGIKDKNDLTKKLLTDKETFLKNMNVVSRQIKEETDLYLKKEKTKNYLYYKEEISKINVQLKEIKDSISTTI